MIVMAFIAFFYLYSLFSYFGVENFIEDGLIKEYFNSHAWHIEILFGGILFGTLFILINRLTEIKAIRKRSFGFNILLKSALYVLSLCIVFIVIFYSFSFFGLISVELSENINEFLSFNLIFSFFTYSLLFVLFINFVISIGQKFGPRLMIDLLTG
jgi:adenylate cyclase